MDGAVYFIIEWLFKCSNEQSFKEGDFMEELSADTAGAGHGSAARILVFNQDMVNQAAESLPPRESLEELGEFFKVLADPTRLKILFALGAGELCVFDLSVSVGASVTSVSHHLGALRRVRLVKGRRDGRIIYYSLDDVHIHSIVNLAREHPEER
jgi:ArsR family transcriptional regulator